MKKTLLLTGLLFISYSGITQQQETVFNYSGIKLTGAWGGPSFGVTGLGEQSVYLRGGYGGLEFNKSIFVGYAAYWLGDKTELSQFEDQKADLSYSGLLLGYAIKPTKLVHPKISLLTAGGTLDIDNEDDDKLFVLQPAAGVEINVFKWFHIDVLGGYRFVSGIDLEGLQTSDLSKPFGEIKLRFGISWGWL